MHCCRDASASVHVVLIKFYFDTQCFSGVSCEQFSSNFAIDFHDTIPFIIIIVQATWTLNQNVFTQFRQTVCYHALYTISEQLRADNEN